MLKKHLADIKADRASIRENFGWFFKGEAKMPKGRPNPYEYDFTRTVDYRFEVPYTPAMKKQIEFMQKGSSIEIPVDYIRSITVRREEFYD